MRALDIIAGAAFLTALVALPFSLYNFRRYTIRSLLLFGIPVFIFLCACWTSQDIGHDEVLHKLKSLKDDCSVSINGKTVLNSKEVISVLQTLDWLPAHHSSPTKRIKLEITDHAPRLVLSLARDSGDPREYWVFGPKYRIMASNEIGRIRTPFFDTY